MVTILQGEVWWADLPDAPGSGAGFRRPVVVVQHNALNRSALATVVCVPLTSNTKRASIRGNVLLESRATGLPKDSVAISTLILAIDKPDLTERVGTLSRKKLEDVLAGIDIMLGR